MSQTLPARSWTPNGLSDAGWLPDLIGTIGATLSAVGEIEIGIVVQEPIAVRKLARVRAPGRPSPTHVRCIGARRAPDPNDPSQAAYSIASSGAMPATGNCIQSCETRCVRSS